MKKRFIALVVAMVMVCCMLAACSGTIHSKKTQEVAGGYHLFYTDSNEKYLSFLENFDETKYEIVDISHSRDNWYVTYKDIEE